MKKGFSTLPLKRISYGTANGYSTESHELFDSTDEPLVKSDVTYYSSLSSFVTCWWSKVLIDLELESLSACFNWSNIIIEPGMSEQEINEQLAKQSEEDLDVLVDELHYLNVLYQVQKQLLALPDRKGMSIESIYALKAGTGQGTQLVKHYQSACDFIFLYSEPEAVTYWKKQGFIPFANGYYVWSQQMDLINRITDHL